MLALENSHKAEILDFDVECRPLAWYGPDLLTKQPTAIAWKFISRGKIECAWIGESDKMSLVLEEEAAMLESFREAYNRADVVTGHYIRGFDLPLLNGALMRLGLPLLEDKMAQDTKMDMVSAHGISKSQENLGAMFELAHPKVGMNTALWAAGNMLLPRGIKATKKRVMGDVRQHIDLRSRMINQGLLGPPKHWGNSFKEGGYVP